MVADRLNFYRFLSHFRCVHRGSFFAEMRTTAVRKLLPEAWGMLSTNVNFFLVVKLFIFYFLFDSRFDSGFEVAFCFFF